MIPVCTRQSETKAKSIQPREFERARARQGKTWNFEFRVSWNFPPCAYITRARRLFITKCRSPRWFLFYVSVTLQSRNRSHTVSWRCWKKFDNIAQRYQKPHCHSFNSMWTAGFCAENNPNNAHSLPWSKSTLSSNEWRITTKLLHMPLGIRQNKYLRNLPQWSRVLSSCKYVTIKRKRRLEFHMLWQLLDRFSPKSFGKSVWHFNLQTHLKDGESFRHSSNSTACFIMVCSTFKPQKDLDKLSQRRSAPEIRRLFWLPLRRHVWSLHE